MSDLTVERLSYIREGENIWQAEDRLPDQLKLNVKGAKLSSIYRRLDSTKPAYTVTGSGGGGTQDVNKTKGECKYTPSPWTLSFPELPIKSYTRS